MRRGLVYAAVRGARFALALGATAIPFVTPGAASSGEAPAPPAAMADTVAVLAPARPSYVAPPSASPRVGFVVIPLFKYSEETRAGLGARGLVYLDVKNHRASTLGGSFLYTQEDQVRATAQIDLHAPESKIELKSTFEFWNTPVHFYGIGPDSDKDDEELYVPERTRFYAALFRYLTPVFKVGVRYEYEDVNMKEIESDGQLVEGDIRGSRGTDIRGLGLLAGWDSRDSDFFPTSGAYHQLYLLFFSRDLGGSDDFKNHIVDLRWYRELRPGRILAVQLFTYGVTEFAPFQRLAALGGREHTRGYRRGRYLDQILVSGQAELRVPLWWRFGGAVFGGIGEVTDSYGRLKVSTLKPTIGAGLRLRPKMGPKLHIRFDAAFGMETPQLYVSLTEAF